MSLRDDLARRGPFLQPLDARAPKAAEPPASALVKDYDVVRRELYREIVDKLDLARTGPHLDEKAFSAGVARFVDEALAARRYHLTGEERERLARDVVAEATGLGPLGPLLSDPSVDDILVNGPFDVYIERFGRLERTEVRFEDDAHLLSIIGRIVERVGRHVDEASPMVDARLADGSRVNAIIPPLALNGPILSIRRFGRERLGAKDLVRVETITEGALRFLEACVSGRLNLLVSGGTGSGKTTFLNALSTFIPESERVITIEDAAELKLSQRHVVSLETRPPNAEGRGRVTARELVINALRMRPDRIIVGEVRSGEAFDMLQAMNTGHDGSLTTVHANTPRDALARVENMVLMAGFELPSRAIREQIAAAIDLVVHVSRLEDGSRRVLSIAEITGLEGTTIAMQDIFTFERRGRKDGRVVGAMTATGVRPQCLRELEGRGIALDRAVFQRAAAAGGAP